MKKIILIIVFAFFFLLVVPLTVSAIEYRFGNMSQDPSPCEYVSVLFVWGLGIVGAVAVTSIAYGGFRYMVGQTQEGKEIIYSALLGLLLLMASWLILYTINPDLATLKCETATTAGGAAPSGAPSEPTTPPATTAPDGTFTYDSGIQSQTPDASSALSSFLNCMANTAPGNVGQISSISDSAGIDKCSTNYSQPPCAHSQGSCHYGGSSSCAGKSYAVDFGDEQNYSAINSAAKTCNTNAYVLNEGNHIHVSIGNASGCGCN